MPFVTGERKRQRAEVVELPRRGRRAMTRTPTDAAVLDHVRDDVAARARRSSASFTSAAVRPKSAARCGSMRNVTAGPLTTMPLKTSTTPLTLPIDAGDLLRRALQRRRSLR